MLQQQKEIPSENDVRQIAEKVFSAPVKSLVRFGTGNHHFVYDVHLSDGKNIVVRVAYREEKEAFEGALYWSNLLKPRGVPLPEIVCADLACADLACADFPFPYMILERLPGTDLRHAYDGLSVPQRRAIASELIKIQSAATGLPEGKGFGYVLHCDGPYRHGSWTSLVAEGISRTRDRIGQARYFSLRCIDRLESLFREFSGYFDDMRPTPFLHDMTTKNVLVHEGRLTGIVDVDSLCYGDPLYLPGLIQAAFLADGLENDYIGYWKEGLGLDAFRQKVVDFYAAQCLAYIMGEVGLQANHAEEKGPPVTDEVGRLRGVLDGLLGRIE